MTVIKGFENHEHWNAVKGVHQVLRNNGFQSLLAGGCVRDALLGRKANDFDIATNATPDQVLALWPRALMVGKAFGVSVLPFDGFQIEVATFRNDLKYKDGRHPEGVEFSTPEQDAKRRDFTINALFFDLESNQVIDFVGGVADLNGKIIRTVGAPDLRFDEDKLRILRAIRFAAQLEFTIDPVTRDALESKRFEIRQVSHERIRDEIIKLLKAPARVTGLNLLLETKIFEVLFPELAQRIQNNQNKWLKGFERITGENLTVLLAYFFSPLACGAEFRFESINIDLIAKNHLKNMRFENEQVDSITFIYKNLISILNFEKLRIGEVALLLARPQAKSLLKYIAQVINRGFEVENKLQAVVMQYLDVEGRAPIPFVNGHDAMSIGFKPGSEMGRVLHEVYLMQIELKIKTKQEAIEFLKAEFSKKSVND